MLSKIMLPLMLVALLVIGAALIAALAGSSMAPGGRQDAERAERQRRDAEARAAARRQGLVDEAGHPVPGRPPAPLADSASAFMESYLAFQYAKRPARSIRFAAPELVADLDRRGPNTALRDRTPRVVQLRAERLGSEAFRVVAQVDDGGPTGRYALSVRFTRPDGTWQAESFLTDDE